MHLLRPSKDKTDILSFPLKANLDRKITHDDNIRSISVSFGPWAPKSMLEYRKNNATEALFVPIVDHTSNWASIHCGKSNWKFPNPSWFSY